MAPTPALAWEHGTVFDNTSVSGYRTAAVTSHNGKLFFVAEFFNEGVSLDAVELRYRAFDGDTSGSGCPTSGLGTIYTVLDDAELGPAAIDYALLTSLSPTNNSSTLVLSHKTGDVDAADLRATTFQKSNGAVTEQILVDLVNLADPSTGDHNHKHSFLIRNPVHDEEHACFTFEDATNNEDAMCAVRDLGDTAWSTTLVNLPTTGTSNNQHATFRVDPSSGARGILYNVRDDPSTNGLLWRAENANEVELGAGQITNDPDFDWPAMDFRASRWYAVIQDTQGDTDEVYFTECPPDPAEASSSIDPSDTGTVVYNDCLSPGAWRELESIGNDASADLRHPVVAADPCGNVFVAWMNLTDETIEFRYRCKADPAPYEWSTSVVTVSDASGPAGWFAGRNGDPMAWTPITYDTTDDMIHLVYAQNDDDGTGVAEDWQIVWAREANPCTCEE